MWKKDQKAMFQLTCDRPTDGQTDTPSYRDARTHLKTLEKECNAHTLAVDQEI